jgi:hypothetical protein
MGVKPGSRDDESPKRIDIDTALENFMLKMAKKENCMIL